MIFDNTIDEDSAKYWCAFSGCQFDKVASMSQKQMSKRTPEKNAIIAALAVDQAKKTGKTDELNEACLNEGLMDVLRGIWNAPPAWVEEPTGFNLCSPSDVFKDDVDAGLAGYQKGQNMAAVTGAVMVGAGIPYIRQAVGKLMSTTAKNPGAAASVVAATTVAVNNPEETVAIVKSCGNILKWCSQHAASLSIAGSIIYGLYQTSSLWLPYIKRLAYEATCGKPLAYVEFNANDTSYRFEYSPKKHTWRLLNSGKLSSQEDVMSFVKTDFAQKFTGRCSSIIQNAITHIDMLKSQAEMSGSKAAMEAAQWLEKNKDQLKSQMFKCKVSLG